MSNLLVNDLEFNQDLDRQAMATVNGGGIVSWFTGKVKSVAKLTWENRAKIVTGLLFYFSSSRRRRPF